MWNDAQYELQHLWTRLLNSMANFSYQEWLLFSILGLILGILCLRGFGSRTGF